MFKPGIRAILPVLATVVCGCGQPPAPSSAQVPAAPATAEGYALLQQPDRDDGFRDRRGRGDRKGDRQGRRPDRGDRRDDRRGDRRDDRRGDRRGDRRDDRADRRQDRDGRRHDRRRDRHGRWGNNRWPRSWWGGSNWWAGSRYLPWWGLGAPPPWLAHLDLVADRMIRLGAYYYPFYFYRGLAYPDYSRPYVWSYGGFMPASAVSAVLPPPPGDAGPIGPSDARFVSVGPGQVFE